MDENSDRKSVKSPEESDAERKTPSSDSSSLRADTPGPMPQFIYSKDDLMEISRSPASKRRPNFLQKDFDTTEGYWDPQRWSVSLDSSRGNSPQSVGSARDRKRPTDIEREGHKRKSQADPKARIKEEEEDLGIVLSPQRRSFGTGCHVTTTTKPARPGSPVDADGRDRRGDRRIGSGRITIDKERERADARDSRDRDLREREPRDLRDLRDERRDIRDFRDGRGRFDREERRGFDRDRFRREDHRDFGERRDRRYGGRMRRHSEEEEPEWFSAGPTSQSDYIELHGFEGPDKRENSAQKHEKEVEKRRRQTKKKKVPTATLR